MIPDQTNKHCNFVCPTRASTLQNCCYNYYRVSSLLKICDFNIFMFKIIWSEYLKYRAHLRKFNLEKIEEILRFSSERYYDTETDRFLAVGKHNQTLVIIPYEINGDSIQPITIHAITRQQIRFRLKTGRFIIQ